MNQIRKETLTRDNIRRDLMKYEQQRFANKTSSSGDFIIYFIFLAFILGGGAGMLFNLTTGIVIGGLLIAPSIYHIIKLLRLYRESQSRKRMIINGEFSVSTDILADIGEEQVYEPHIHYRHTHYHAHRNVPFFFFYNNRWRVVQTREHYEWSQLYRMSQKGLENTSIIGDSFYTVFLDGDGEIGYIYNTKLFEYKETQRG